MAVTRKAQKQDIRSVQFKSDKNAPLPVGEAPSKASAAATQKLIQHNPAEELRRIAFISLPLLAILIILTYLEYTRHWVIPFANWLMGLGG